MRGRRPIAIGDDLTNLDAVHAGERLGRFGIAVGAPGSGHCNFPQPRALRDWLTLIAAAGTPAN